MSMPMVMDGYGGDIDGCGDDDGDYCGNGGNGSADCYVGSGCDALIRTFPVSSFFVPSYHCIPSNYFPFLKTV